MFLLVRDEDAPTVASAIRAFAEDEGLVPLDLEAEAQNPLAMLSVLSGPRVLVSADADQVTAYGLETLDIAEPDEWGEAISKACSSEVIVFEPASDGVRVYVFDDGELEETIEVPLDPSGRTRAPALVDLTDDEEGRKALENGIDARAAAELVPGLLRAFGARGPGQDAAMVAFVDPLDEERDDDEDAEPVAPRLIADALPAAEMNGRVGGSVDSLNGSLFVVHLEGGGPVEGVRLELSGDALALFDVSGVDVTFRTREADERELRSLDINPVAEPKIVITLEDVFLERVDIHLPMIDPTDMFSTMQRIMNAGDARQRNTMVIDVRGTAKAVGEGSLELRVSALNGTVDPSEAIVPVHVRAPAQG